MLLDVPRTCTVVAKRYALSLSLKFDAFFSLKESYNMSLILDTLKKKMRRYKDTKTLFLKKILRNIDYLKNVSDDILSSMAY